MTPAIPDRLPPRTEDIALHTMARLSVPQIHGVIELEGALDSDRLRRALRLLLDAEPVLGCRFVPRWLFPYWQRLAPAELDAAELLQETDAAATEPDFLGDDLPADTGPRLAALLIHDDETDRLVLKVHHQAAAAGGVKELLYRLAAIYRALADDPDHTPIPRSGSRSLMQIYRPLMPGAVFGLLWRMATDLWDAFWPPRHLQLPMGATMEGPPRFATLHIGPDRVAAIRADAPDATLNDLMLAGVARALARQAGPEGWDTLRIWGTVDLRRYLPDRQADGLCNLSGFMYVNIGRVIGDTYSDTVARVKATVDRIKGLWPGLGYPIGSWLGMGPVPLGLIDAMAGTVGALFLPHMPPVLTNMGAIDEAALDFGEPAVRHARLVVPTSFAPGLIMGVSGFRGGVDFSMGHFCSALPPDQAAALLDAIDAELPGGEA